MSRYQRNCNIHLKSAEWLLKSCDIFIFNDFFVNFPETKSRPNDANPDYYFDCDDVPKSTKNENNCYAMYVIWWSTRVTEPNRIEMESANEGEIEDENNNSIESMKVAARFRNVSEKILIKFQLNLLKLYVLANVSVRFCTNSLLWSDQVCGIDQLRTDSNGYGYGRHTEQKKNVDVGCFVSKCQEAQSHRQHETDMCMCCGLCVIISHLLGYWISNK